MIVVSVGIGGWHPEGLARLDRSLDAVGYTGARKFWTELPPGCPTHIQTPYAFKPYAVQAARDAGHTQILWVDAAVWAIRPLDPLWAVIAHDGHLLVTGGWTTGQWCADHALAPLGITREEAFAMPHLLACVMGFDFAHPRTCDFFAQWMTHAQGIAFRGPWTNQHGEASANPLVLGHRHDQTVASVLSIQLGMPWITTDLPIIYHETEPQPVGPHVCLLSRGGTGEEWTWYGH